jgi:hypothetical protein
MIRLTRAARKRARSPGMGMGNVSIRHSLGRMVRSSHVGRARIVCSYSNV